MKKLYDIEKLSCKYYDRKTKKDIEVLELDDIVISRGEITVILGPSGSGKSTFMEAISLMSDTIDPENSRNVFFYPQEDLESKINLVNINKEGINVQKLRLNSFCFIFQDTNIMGNLSPIENVALPKMVHSPQNALLFAEKILKNCMNLQIDLTKDAGEYSGGQKQRFAFARAFMAKGNILFGDEPTGNLDKYNSEKLFGVIKQYITSSLKIENESINKIGAVIVTHNIDLALEFADRIIVVVKPERIEDEKDIYGRINVKGYSNPFLVYHNSENTLWRKDTMINGNGNHSALLPPINDDGSTRFTYMNEENDPNKPLIKDKIKKEIIFFLNNSYAGPQKVLVDEAKKLVGELRELNPNDLSYTENRNRLFNHFQNLKTGIIEIIESYSGNRITLEDFEKNYLSALNEKFENIYEIQDLISNN